MTRQLKYLMPNSNVTREMAMEMLDTRREIRSNMWRRYEAGHIILVTSRTGTRRQEMDGLGALIGWLHLDDLGWALERGYTEAVGPAEEILI